MICDIDEAQLDRELDALLLQLPPEALEGQLLEPRSDEWRKAFQKFKLAHRLHASLAPNWELDEQDAEDVGVELAERYWPGGIGNADNWGPWAKLAFFALTTVAANFDDEAGAFRPLHAPVIEADPAKKAEEGGDGDAG